MKRSRHKSPPSTTGRYLPGVGYTLTRANIAWANLTRTDRGLDPLTEAEDIVSAFAPTDPDGRKLPTPSRYLHRARRLLRPKGGVR